MPAAPNPVSCPHYPPTAITNPTVICLGCGSLIADHRHPQNQANGIANVTVAARPEQRDRGKSKERVV